MVKLGVKYFSDGTVEMPEGIYFAGAQGISVTSPEIFFATGINPFCLSRKAE